MESKNTNKNNMTELQSSLSGNVKQQLIKYKEYTSGNKSILFASFYEICILLFSSIPGLLGAIFRSCYMPLFLRSSGQKLKIGKSVSIRNPGCISLGNNVALNDYSALDARYNSKLETKDNSGITLHNNVIVGNNSSIIAKDNSNILICDNVNISTYCRIATQTKITIKENTLIAAYCYIGCGNHKTTDLETPIIGQGIDLKDGVYIGENSWIGTRSTIVDGVSIGKNCIVGAHSLVLESIPDNSVAVGTPAKIIKYRK